MRIAIFWLAVFLAWMVYWDIRQEQEIRRNREAMENLVNGINLMIRIQNKP